jgi:hypothetical protein
MVKGTFDLAPDGTTPASAEQVPVFIAPVYRGAEGESSLLYEQDLSAAKPHTDIYLNATAHAPHGYPTREMTVGLGTPAGTKTLLVKGDRRWERNRYGEIAATETTPFTTMPLIYERAYGGYDRQDPDPLNHRLDPRNPVGTGLFTHDLHRDGKLLPNIAPLESALEPVGFGALCSYWQPRLSFQGTYDQRWMDTKKPLLPDDFDPRWLQCAPLDQQVRPHLRGGEPFALLGMTPSGTLRFSLPKHYFAFSTHVRRKVLEHRAQLDTVVIEPDHPRVILTWRSVLSCHHLIDDIDFTEIIEKEYVNLGFSE